MKGISLPINALVIVAIAVIVLLGIVAIYFGGFNPFSTTVSIQSAKNTGCDTLVRYGCNEDPENIKVDTNMDGDTADADDNLWYLCKTYYNANTKSDCRKLCGCPVVA